METKKLISNRGNSLIGPLLIKPDTYSDSRGYFYESWNQISFNHYLGEDVTFFQDNHSSSIIGVLRGLHYQIHPKPQGKLVRCTKGSIFDVAVDIRKNSATFGEWVSVKLNNLNKFMFWIPVGFAHGFLSLKDESEVLYKTSGFYSKEHQRSIRWDDKTLNIKWPLQKIKLSEPILSERDKNAPYFNQAYIF